MAAAAPTETIFVLELTYWVYWFGVWAPVAMIGADLTFDILIYVFKKIEGYEEPIPVEQEPQLCYYCSQHFQVKKTQNPLETFTIFFENFQNLFFDNLSFNIFINFFFIIFIFYIFMFPTKSIFSSVNIIKNVSESFQLIYFNFKNFVKNSRFERFFFFILIIFIFILFTNFGGFSLYELSFTSHAAISLFLSFILFFNYFTNMLITFNEKVYRKFWQNNLNFGLRIVLLIIELVSFFIRPFSLGIRLFANILSGHILIHIFFNAFIYFYKIIFWLSLFLFLFCVFVLLLEIFVASVQSYIFLILSFIYLQDITKLH